VFTHHHHAEQWDNTYDPTFVFWPFAVNTDQFRDHGEPHEYDMEFSGILRNPDRSVPQTELRIDVQEEMFYTFGETKLRRKPEYRKFNLFWRAKPTSKPYQLLNRLLNRTPPG
jgi:hypothetical protein